MPIRTNQQNNIQKENERKLKKKQHTYALSVSLPITLAAAARFLTLESESFLRFMSAVIRINRFFSRVCTRT